jgi:hypothetical protein
MQADEGVLGAIGVEYTRPRELVIEFPADTEFIWADQELAPASHLMS